MVGSRPSSKAHILDPKYQGQPLCNLEISSHDCIRRALYILLSVTLPSTRGPRNNSPVTYRHNMVCTLHRVCVVAIFVHWRAYTVPMHVYPLQVVCVTTSVVPPEVT